MSFEQDIFHIHSENEFTDLALEIFRYQASENPVYKKYIGLLKLAPATITEIEDIPFLPIEFFKKFDVISGNRKPTITFESSGTSGQISSKHHIVSEEIYRDSFTQTFSSFFRKPEELCILALLPSYLERGNSSLVYMMDHLINLSMHEESGFYLNNLKELSEILKKRILDGHPTLLLGVSYALLDLAEQFPIKLSENISIMETGGMKGKRKEMIREELHEHLKLAFNKKHIHSEYGMTELLSQAYLQEDGHFKSPAWMKVLARDIYEPGSILEPGKAGAINIIDLANIYSCSFIATGDLGTRLKNGSFVISGRFDQAEVRGCNLMVL